MSENRKANRLLQETSPYLLQHAYNPVDWYPWGPEALARARREDKPILLSIGYSACHWCHVMEGESFENEEIARLMNEHFVPIKVDREERPDIDEIYMGAVQLMTGSGGWPLTVFLTPELKPFYGGTYFPPEDRWGRPGFATVLREVARVYREQRDQVDTSAEQLAEHLRGLSQVPRTMELLSEDLIRGAVRELGRRFDAREGGFTPAPKFPPSASLSLLLRHHRNSRDPESLAMAELTLDKMAAGGIYDHLGGGFHRYATDERWLVPHFEKMLYDNALLARVYLEAYQVTGKERYARVAGETLHYLIRDMQGAEGGYFSSEDADSEGVEGKFYVWSAEEVRRILGGDAEIFCRAYDVTDGGNWEGHNILHRVRDSAELADERGNAAEEVERILARGRALLFAEREKRVRPGLDDKVLTSWNGLAIVAMARAHRVLGAPRFLESARRAARFIQDTLIREGRLLATYRKGVAKLPAYLDDYAFFMAGLIELYESDFDLRWLESAARLADELERLFWDRDHGGFFFTGSDHEELLLRSKPGYDGALPSGNAMAATYLLRLATYTGEERYERLGHDTMRAFLAQMERTPAGFAQMLCALDYYLARRKEIAIVGPEDAPASREALERIWRLYAPNEAVAFLDPSWPHRAALEEKVPLLKGKSGSGDQPLFYVCENYQCSRPTASVEEVERALQPA